MNSKLGHKMKYCESEKLELPKAIRIRGAAEQWLGNFYFI